VLRVRGIVYIVLAGHSLIALGRFMALPFFALYLPQSLGASYVVSGLVVGVAALSSLWFGLHRALSDRIGRVRTLIASTALLGAVFVADGLVRSLVSWPFRSWPGVGFATEGPAFSALLTDLTPESERLRVFGGSYWGVNVGAALGPLLGTVTGAGDRGLSFVIAGGVMLTVTGFMVFGLPRDRPAASADAAPPFGETLRRLGQGVRHPVMSYFLLARLLGGLAYTQLETTLGQYVGSHIPAGARLFGDLMAANGLTVIVLQPWVARKQGHWPLLISATAGSVTMGVASCLYGLARTWPEWIATHGLLSAGEVIQSPVNQTVVSLLAPPDRRALYFTLQNLAWGLAGWAGPARGGLALATGGQWTLFGGMGLLRGAAGWLYWKSLQRDGRFHRPVSDPRALAEP
jgi:MFS family permease